ncbi:MAG: DUF362 domain-containing protein [Candidatus Bathyarchaeota archaeon]|nr:DUF362 domain-containing protein [Candidatus Bathyarchaeota archaeon]
MESLDLIEYSFKKEIKNVVIKPNMCYYWDYSTGQTTDPRFVALVIEILREKISPNVEISIVESDASAMKCKYAFKFLAYEKIAKQHNIKLVNLSEEEAEPVKAKVRNQNFSVTVPQIIKNADLRINIPKIKHISFCKISCALKNMFGCNPHPQKFKYHSKLSETIVALNKAMPFDLCILDGITVSGPPVSKLGLVMASQDPVAIDTAAAIIAGVNPKSVEHIVLGEKEDLGRTSFIAKGMNPNYFKRRYPQKTLTDKATTLGYRLVRVFGLEKRLMLK